MNNFKSIIEENLLEITKNVSMNGRELEYSYFEAWDSIQNKTVRVKTHDVENDLTHVYVADVGTDNWSLIGTYNNQM